MSETLPPIVGNGVVIKFVFPFDSSLPREATVFWRRRIGIETLEQKYADIAQSGTDPSLEQIACAQE